MSKPNNIISRLGKNYANHVTELEAQNAAVREALAVIEFDLGGHVLDANENFLALFGFSMEELRGKHRRDEEQRQPRRETEPGRTHRTRTLAARL